MHIREVNQNQTSYIKPEESYLSFRDNSARKLQPILLGLSESDGLLPRKVYFYYSGAVIKFSMVRAIFKGRGKGMALEKMKETKLKVHFIVGNDIGRSEYIESNLKE